MKLKTVSTLSIWTNKSFVRSWTERMCHSDTCMYNAYFVNFFFIFHFKQWYQTIKEILSVRTHSIGIGVLKRGYLKYMYHSNSHNIYIDNLNILYNNFKIDKKIKKKCLHKYTLEKYEILNLKFWTEIWVSQPPTCY